MWKCAQVATFERVGFAQKSLHVVRLREPVGRRAEAEHAVAVEQRVCEAAQLDERERAVVERVDSGPELHTARVVRESLLEIARAIALVAFRALPLRALRPLLVAQSYTI